ncbi:MAG: hypothetical protein HOQ17_02515 [Gemmatimonadaceae bacterium]|nr:hypothetical protein [Gemmatimonadaceae bacterium]NUP56404.1 hypothetical protein [Gemmatimonadaceae bacterium]NUP71770.1 hypothetical protein [Gemmatimonadaceae bacterium]NUR32828.1 hypothetical protein [Gemmatimonadaceae bacterium]NUS31905.1 hypothetical protein [Gemmatimonadaceae bacterium]
MGTRDPRVDAYIAKQKEFAKPILTRIRDVVHAACPEVEETLKWSSPHFMYKGGMMCGMAGFKEHAIFGFWKGTLIDGVSPNRNNGGDAMGNFGKLTSVKDLPSKSTMTSLIKQAMKLNEQGITVPRPKRASRPEATVPAELQAALAKNKKAATHFAAFPPSHRREYVEWISEAKRDETKTKRVAQAVEWIAEGKGRNWKYERTG